VTQPYPAQQQGWGNVEQLQAAPVQAIPGAARFKGPAAAIDLNASAMAVSRTLAGQNPAVNDLPGAKQMLALARKYAATMEATGEGGTLQSVYRSRFQPTPPIQAAA
jgi:hypothetical protein